MLLQLEDISYFYGKQAALSHINLTIKQGMNLLLGPNGAGKSTLFALLTLLQNPHSGSMVFDGEPLDKNHRNLLREFGVVFQLSSLDLDLTVEQNLMYYGHLHGLNQKQVTQRAQPLLDAFALADFLNRTVRSLNIGHRRRLEIVRALIHHPKLLLLDEPSSSLDIPAREALNDCLRNWIRQHQLSVLWSTHLIEDIESSDHIILLHKGRCFAQGSAQELCSTLRCDNVSTVFRKMVSGAETQANIGLGEPKMPS